MIGMIIRTAMVWVYWFVVTYIVVTLVGGAFTHHSWEYVHKSAIPLGKLVGSFLALFHFLDKEL